MGVTEIWGLIIIAAYIIMFVYAITTKKYSKTRYIGKYFLIIGTYFIAFDTIYDLIQVLERTPVLVKWATLAILCGAVSVALYREFKKLHKYQKDTALFLTAELKFLVVEFFIETIVYLSWLNLLIYIMFPGEYIVELPIQNSRLLLLFEFLYYSFTVTITYSSSSINANGAIAKTLQMFHVATFYFYATEVVFKLLTDTEKE